MQTEDIPNGRRDFETTFYYHDSGINKSNKRTNCILQKPKIKAINDRRSMPGNHLKTMRYNNIKNSFRNYIFDYHDGWEIMFNKRFERERLMQYGRKKKCIERWLRNSLRIDGYDPNTIILMENGVFPSSGRGRRAAPVKVSVCPSLVLSFIAVFLSV